MRSAVDVASPKSWHAHRYRREHDKELNHSGANLRQLYGRLLMTTGNDWSSALVSICSRSKAKTFRTSSVIWMSSSSHQPPRPLDNAVHAGTAGTLSDCSTSCSEWAIVH